MNRDLVVLSSCQNSKAALQVIVGNHSKLTLRAISADFFVHPNSDPGCLKQSHGILQSQRNRFDHALVVFDRDGCGSNDSPEKLETYVEAILNNQGGWNGRARAIVIDPELEAWVWSDSPHVDNALGWNGRIPNLRSWMQDEGYLVAGQFKPEDPKTALQEALKVAKIRRTSAIYADLARNVGYARCTDRSFLRLCSILKEWFGVEPPGAPRQQKLPGQF